MSSYEPPPGMYRPPPPPGMYPPPPPPPYAGYAPPPAIPKNGLGITALVLAVVALVFSWSVIGGVVIGLVALIIGFAARGRVKRGEATNGGVATAGVVLGALAIIVALVFIPIWIGFFKSLGFGDYVSCLEQAGTDRTSQVQCETSFRDKIEQEYGVTIAPTR